MLKKERFGGFSIWVGLLWVLSAWFIYISGYAGFAAGALALPLSAGYWLCQTCIEPLSATVANYLNAFVLSVPAGVLATWFIGKILTGIINVCKSRIVFLRPQSRRRVVFAKRKSVLNTPLFKRPKDVEN